MLLSTVKQLSKYVWWSDQNKATFIDWFYWFLFENFLDKIFYSNFWVWLICKCGLSLSVNSILLVFFYLFMNGLYFISQGLTEYHFLVTKAPCIKTVFLLLCGSVYLSMPRHDYVKSGRLAVTEKTEPINTYLHI